MVLSGCSVRSTAPMLHSHTDQRDSLNHQAIRTPPPHQRNQILDEDRIREVRSGATKRIKALGAQRKLKEAIQELAGLSQLGVQPDTQAATALVSACAQAGNMEMAESVFEQLFGEFLRPDEVTFAVLLRGYGGKSPPQWGAIDSTLTRMRSTFGMEPSAGAFSCGWVGGGPWFVGMVLVCGLPRFLGWCVC